MTLASLHLSTPHLRRVLAADAISGALTALLHLLFAGTLATWFGLDPAVISATGWACIGYVVLATALARQARPARGWLLLLIVANVFAGIACLVLAWDTAGVTPLGQAYLTTVAVAVLLLADLEFLGWRAPALRMAV